jgi:type I restriction enzyme S subunit
MTDQTTTIPKGWKMTTLGEVATFCYGKMPDKDRVTLSGKYPVYSGYQTIGYYDEFNSDEDLIVVARGVGGTGDVKISPKKSFITNLSIIVKVNEVKLDSKYLFYKYSVKNLRYLDSGSAQSQIVISDLKNIQLLLPPLPEQRAIAAVLSSLDDKIELLREQNKTLEATAQAIFKEWFVRFNFPNENGEPYATAGGKMIDSELGPIPEGWRVGRLTEIFDFMEGPGIRNWQYTESGMKFINIRLIHNGDIDVKNANHISNEEADTKYKHFHLKELDMVVSTSGTLGRSAIVRKEHLPLMLNTSVIRFRPKDGTSYGYMYQFLNSTFFQNELESRASGSAQLNFGPVHLKEILMIIPPEDILEKFSSVANDMYKKIILNFTQIQTLSTLRDTLLPKLMKGEIRVKSEK